MRISDWSSDVCSSDLQAVAAAGRGRGAQRRRGAAAVRAGLAAGAAAGGGLMDKRIAGQYWELTKPRVVSLIVFTAVVGMFLAVPGLPPLRESVFGLLGIWLAAASRSEEHTSELQSLMCTSYAVFCLKTTTEHETK